VNPLSPLTYYFRHKRQTLLMFSLVALVTMGICIMVSMVYPILEHTEIVVLGPLSHFSLVYPTLDRALDPTVVAQIRTHPHVARMIPENGRGLVMNVPSLVSLSTTQVLGITEADLPDLLRICGLRLREGRLLTPNTNEIMLSEELADALGLQIGDAIDRSASEQRYYFAIPSPLIVVGILESEPTVAYQRQARLALVSYEYIAHHELYAPRQSGLLVVAQDGHKATVDGFLETAVASSRTEVETHRQKSASIAEIRHTLNMVIGTVDGLVAVVIALVVGMINQIALTRRLTDLGVLNAMGFHRTDLTRRLVREVAAIAAISWLVGLLLAWPALAYLRSAFYAPRGVALNLANPLALWFALPIPLTVVGFAICSVVRVFSRLDAVAIIERGPLSVEETGDKKQEQGRKKHRERQIAAGTSMSRPLSFLSFYRRHRHRAAMLIAVIGLMILGVALPGFFFGSVVETQKPFMLNYLRYVAQVQPAIGNTVDAEVMAQIRAHPDVADVIPIIWLSLQVSIPPVSESVSFVYGASEEHLPYLVDVFQLRLKEGRLPRPRSNEIALPEAAALNRGLHIGDVVGRPTNDRDRDLTTDMVVVGILEWQGASHTDQSQRSLSTEATAVGFASAEYLQSHELYANRPTRLLVIPKPGRKSDMDSWLEQTIASRRTLVETYERLSREMNQVMRGVYLLLAGVEGLIAVVAAIALAALNFIFYSQRKQEFGVLHAVGHSRPWLVLRTAGETTSVVTVAWFVGAAVCVLGLCYARSHVYAPLGLDLNLLNLSPWLFTLPLPLVTIAVGTIMIAWMLHKLDPVIMIERR
jgi:putative ABC transport system permease protein